MVGTDVLTQSASETDEAAMNVKSCLKVNNVLLYRTVSLKLEGRGLYTKLGARRRAVIAGRQLRVSSLRVRTVEVVS
jgi:hypothetical protein